MQPRIGVEKKIKKLHIVVGFGGPRVVSKDVNVFTKSSFDDARGLTKKALEILCHQNHLFLFFAQFSRGFSLRLGFLFERCFFH